MSRSFGYPISRPGLASISWMYAASFAVSAIGLTPYSTTASEIIDIRDGVRTNFYGAHYTGNPPSGDFYGWAMAFGDVDGDGYMDFFSSSSNGDGPNDQYGPEHDAYLFFGRPRSQFDSVYSVDSPGVADIVFYKGGYQMVCADLDDDGIDDAVLAEPLGTGRGIYIVFGQPRSQLRPVYDFKTDSPSYTPPDVYIAGLRLGGGIIDGGTPGGFDYASRSLVTGDFNGDGFADLAFGDMEARGPFGGRGRAGAVYVVFGRPRAMFPPAIDIDLGTAQPHPDVVIYGESGENYPFALAAGDLDGDGISELVASTYYGYGEESIDPAQGEIHCFWGKRTWQPVYDTQIDEFGFAMDGTFGFQMGTGDLDGDGRDELILGSYDGDWAQLPDGRLHQGAYRIYFGRQQGLWPKWSDAVEMTDVFVVGADQGEAFTQNGPLQWGMCFSLATGNRDGDGYDDLLIGAGRGYRPPEPIGNSWRAGRAYMIRGRPRGAWQPFIDFREEYDALYYGVDGCDESGNCTSPGGYGIDRLGFTTALADLDGNGLDELFISAPHADGPGNTCGECGEIYVIFDADSTATPIAVIPSLARAALLPNYPNPFNASTTFRFVAPEGSLVSLTIYDVRGREVARPLLPRRVGSTLQDIPWDGRDSRGQPLASGMYFVKLRAGNETFSRKVLLVH